MQIHPYIVGMDTALPHEEQVAPVNQGVVIREAASQALNSPTIPAEDKGKEVAVESLPPKKRRRTVPPSGLKEQSSTDKADLKDTIAPYLSLNEAAGPSGQALATRAVVSIVEALNLAGGDLWSNLHLNNNLLDSGLRTSVVVSIFPLLTCFIRTLYPSFFPQPVSIFLPQSILNLLQYDLVRDNREAYLHAQLAETTSAAEAVARTHAEQLNLLTERMNDLKKSWEEEKTRADEAEQRNKVLQQALELAQINDAKVKAILDNLCTENCTLKAEVRRLNSQEKSPAETSRGVHC